MEIVDLQPFHESSDLIRSNKESDDGNDDFAFKEKRQRLLPVTSKNSLPVEESEKNVSTLLIHRVICLYFMQFVKRTGHYKPSIFLRNNPHIGIKALFKYEKSQYVVELLNDLKQKHGNGFLALDKRVQWLTNNTLISLSEIPEEVLQTYSYILIQKP